MASTGLTNKYKNTDRQNLFPNKYLVGTLKIHRTTFSISRDNNCKIFLLPNIGGLLGEIDKEENISTIMLSAFSTDIYKKIFQSEISGIAWDELDIKAQIWDAIVHPDKLVAALDDGWLADLGPQGIEIMFTKPRDMKISSISIGSYDRFSSILEE